MIHSGVCETDHAKTIKIMWKSKLIDIDNMTRFDFQEVVPVICKWNVWVF